MLLYEEHYTQMEKYMRLLPLAALLAGFIAWKILLPLWAISFIVLLIVVVIMTFHLRSGSVHINRDGIVVKGGSGVGANTTTIPVSEIGMTYIGERRQGGYVYSLTDNAPESATRATPIPACLPTYLFLKQGVVIERKGTSIWKFFIPSGNPEQLFKAIEDSKKMSHF